MYIKLVITHGVLTQTAPHKKQVTVRWTIIILFYTQILDEPFDLLRAPTVNLTERNFLGPKKYQRLLYFIFYGTYFYF